MSTKKVRMLVKISGSHDGKDWPAIGDTVTLPAEEADNMIRNGMAAPASVTTENAMLDAGLAETAVGGADRDAQKSVRLQMNPQPHADEPDAYHVPVVPGEQEAAEAGQEAVDAANVELQGQAVTEDNIAIREGKKPTEAAPKAAKRAVAKADKEADK